MSQKRITIGGSELDGEVAGGSATVGGSTASIISLPGDREALIDLNGRQVLVPYEANGDSIEFILDGEHIAATVTAPGARRRGSGREHSMAAPMPGVVLKILVQPGDDVAKGAPLLVLEAMKMEHQIRAPRDGRVASVGCSVGELVQPGTDLIELQEVEP